jgi:hypothetical protein
MCSGLISRKACRILFIYFYQLARALSSSNDQKAFRYNPQPEILGMNLMKRIILAVFLLLSLAISLDMAPAIDVGTEHSVCVADQSISTDHNTLGTCDYIGNSNTHKFHVPGCSSIDRYVQPARIHTLF